MRIPRVVNVTSRISGDEIGVPEVLVFGYFKFREAVHVNNGWAAYSGPQIKFVIEGEVNWEEEDGSTVQVFGNNAIIFPKGLTHRVVNGVYPPSEQLWIILRDPEEAGSSLLSGGAHGLFSDLLNSSARLWEINEPCRRDVLDLGRMLVEPELAADDGLVRAEIRAKLHGVLIEFWKMCSTAGPRGGSSELVVAVKAFFEENWSEGIAIADVAARFHCSRGHLHAVFRREIGMSPNDYLQLLRIKRSCSSLQSSDHSITEIALDNGFGSAQYFSKVFRKHLGLSPSEYRVRPHEGALHLPAVDS